MTLSEFARTTILTRNVLKSPEAHFAYGGNPMRIHLLLRFSKFEDELIRLAANRLVEHLGRAGVRRIGENRTLGVELEARGFDLSAHGRGLDAMQGLGYICGSTQSGGMIENYVYATRLQRFVYRPVKRGRVNRPHELVMQVVIISGNPEQVELLGELQSFERRGGRYRYIWMGDRIA